MVCVWLLSCFFRFCHFHSVDINNFASLRNPCYFFIFFSFHSSFVDLISRAPPSLSMFAILFVVDVFGRRIAQIFLIKFNEATQRFYLAPLWINHNRFFVFLLRLFRYFVFNVSNTFYNNFSVFFRVSIVTLVKSN